MLKFYHTFHIFCNSSTTIFAISVNDPSMMAYFVYLIFVTCTTCSAGVKISRLVSKNSSNNGYFTTITTLVVVEWWWWWHHHHHHNTTTITLYHHRHHQIQLCCNLRCFVAKLVFFCDLHVFGVKFFSWKWCWCQKNDKYQVWMSLSVDVISNLLTCLSRPTLHKFWPSKSKLTNSLQILYHLCTPPTEYHTSSW